MEPSGPDNSETFDPATYVAQFSGILERFDEYVFLPHKAAIKAIIHPGRFSPHHVTGYHLGNMVMYSVIRLAHPEMIRLIGQNYIESYTIWGKEIELLAEKKLVGNGALGFQWTDADFRLMLISYALAIVRYRVLQNKDFFPLAKLRTLANVYSDETIPAEHRQKLFKRRSDIPREIFSNQFLLDAHILLLFVSMAMEDGRPIKDALRYLTNT